MKVFEAKQEKFVYLFTASAILTNFLHRRNQHWDAIGQQNGEGGWAGDY